jgi:hypothetical protein
VTDTSPTPSVVAQTIAAGGNPPFEQTFTHPVHGELTFRAATPTNRQVLAHRVALDTQLIELPDAASARVPTLLLAAGLAAMEMIDAATGEARMMMLPELVAQRTEEPTEHGTMVRKHFYDAAEDTEPDFVIEVWTAYSAWRLGILQEVDGVKGPSGETIGSDSSTESTSPTVSPSTTPA